MVNSATTVLFNVLPGVATEVACVFDLDSPKVQLDTLGFFNEKIDAAGPARRRGLEEAAGRCLARRRAPPGR